MADEKSVFMREALDLARLSLGTVAPNPAVGCVLVRDHHVIARGRTAPGGRPHAETEALKHAGTEARGAVAYVSLEPCVHYGQTPPCTEALIKAGIKGVVVACQDPDPRVRGRGLERLQQAGLSVSSGVYEDEAREVNIGFFTLIEKGRPYLAEDVCASSYDCDLEVFEDVGPATTGLFSLSARGKGGDTCSCGSGGGLVPAFGASGSFGPQDLSRGFCRLF